MLVGDEQGKKVARTPFGAAVIGGLSSPSSA